MARIRKNGKWVTIKFTDAEVFEARLLHMNGAPPYAIYKRTGIPYQFLGPILAGRSHSDRHKFPAGYKPIEESTWTLSDLSLQT